MKLEDWSAEDLIALGATKLLPSISLTLYFDTSLYAQRDGIIACADDYLARLEREIKWYSDTILTRFKPASPALLHFPASRLSDPAAGEQGFAWIFFGADRYEGLSTVLFEAKSRRDDKQLSYVRATFPPAAFAPDFAGFVALAKAWAGRLRVFHGVGGLAFNESAQTAVRQANSRFTFVAANRFLGFEVENPDLTARCAQDGIKSVNWLTLIGGVFVERLGGEGALRKKLGPDIQISSIPGGGLLLQAGKLPGFGDVNAEDVLPAYREVARALKPVRVKKHFPLGPAELGSFGWEGTDAWLARFD